MKEQKIYKENNAFEIAKKYYQILFIVNDLKISDLPTSLVAFSALNGSITSPPIRDRFIKEFGTSRGTVSNIISELKKFNILVKDDDNKIRVNPQILLPFSQGVFLQIKLENEANRQDKEGNSSEVKSTEGIG